MIHEFWEDKTQNQKIILIIMGYFIIVLIFYFILWSPLHEKKRELIADIQSKTVLLQWMGENAPWVKRHRSIKPNANHQEVFTIVENTLKDLPEFSDKISMTRVSENKITLHFKEIAFDTLMNTLLSLWETNNLDITEMQINRLVTPGNVEAKLTLLR